MSPAAIILVLLSALIHVGWNYLTKSSANPKAFSLLKGTLIIGIFMAALPVIPFKSIPSVVWIYISLSAVIHTVYIIALSTAYETGDISFVYPIARSAPAFVPLAAFIMLGEKISVRGALGIAIVIICVFLIQLRGEARSELQRLWQSVRQKDSIWAFITLSAVVSYTLVDKAGMVVLGHVTEITRGLHGPVYYLLETALSYLFFWLYMGRRTWPAFGFAVKYEWLQALAAALGTMASYSLILHVMQTEVVSYIVTLRQSSVLVAVLIGWFAFREPYMRLRVVVAGCMLVGFFLVATTG